mgnify:CR=1 FL=1
MAQGIWIPMSIGRRIDANAGQTADFFVECADDPKEVLSPPIRMQRTQDVERKLMFFL